MTKRFLFTLISIAYQTNILNSQEPISNNVVNSTDTYQNDARTIFNLISEIQIYDLNSNDSTLQRNEKQKQIKNKLINLNQEHRGKHINLNHCKLIDVKPEKILSEHGKLKAKNLVERIKRDPEKKAIIKFGGPDPEKNYLLMLALAMEFSGCDQCYRDTGKFNVVYQLVGPKENEYSLGEFYVANSLTESTGQCNQDESYEQCNEDRIIVTVIQTLDNRNHALSLKKGEEYALSGNIHSMNYESNYTRRLSIVSS